MSSSLTKEYRLTWAYTPMTQNVTRVSFVEASKIDDAKAILTDHIERTEGRRPGIYTTDLTARPPGGKVLPTSCTNA